MTAKVGESKQERLLAAIRTAYVEGRIDVEEFERDTELVLQGGTPGAYRTGYSTEEPAGPYQEFVPKYWLAPEPVTEASVYGGWGGHW